MPFSVVMPALEMAQETGKLIAWRKQEGDRVTKGEPLLEIETDKAVVEVEAPADGVLAGISAHAGADIPVGQTIAWIVNPGEQPPTPNQPAGASPAQPARAKTETASNTQNGKRPEHKESPGPAAKISPKARRMAKELGVDLGALRGSGPGGEILANDVQSAASSTTHVETAALGRPSGPAVSGAGQQATLDHLTTVARLMAERTTQSWTTVPHFFVSRDVDMSAFNAYRAELAAQAELTENLRITHTDLLIAIVARTLVKHPRLNASWTADGIQLHDDVNMGLAIAVADGVVAVVIPDAHLADVPAIARRRTELADRARSNDLRPADITGATFTISNLGMYQVSAFTAIIVPPQAAILAVGSIADRVIAIDGKAVVRPTMTLTLSCDHRVIDGARAAMFLNDLHQALQNPRNIATHLAASE